LIECKCISESFHKIKLYLAKALHYHEKLKKLLKAIKTAITSKTLDNIKKQNVSQDNPDNMSLNRPSKY